MHQPGKRVDLPQSFKDGKDPNYIALKKGFRRGYASVHMCLCGEIDNSICIYEQLGSQRGVRDIPFNEGISLLTFDILKIFEI
jgi:hypothetical protein